MEIQLDLGRLVDRLAIEPGGFELILHDRLKSRVLKYGGAADELRVCDLPILANFHLDHHNPADPARFGNRGIRQRAGFDQL